MISSPFQGAARGWGRNVLDLPVAALAGLAVAFAAFAMPTDLLSQFVGSSGLSTLFSAAEPPLGLKARVGIGATGALLISALVYFLLRMLDRIGLDRSKAEDEGPRLRRRDAHPDAPVRRPISAARDFGEPAIPTPSEATLPRWLPEEDIGQPAQDEPVACVEMPVRAADREEVSAPAPGLAELMQRLERGLARRASPPVEEALAETPPQVFPEAPDDRLQNAIDSLQRLAARQT